MLCTGSNLSLAFFVQQESSYNNQIKLTRRALWACFHLLKRLEKLFGIGEAKATEVAAKANPTPVNVDAANKAAENAIANYVAKMNLTADGLVIGFDGASGR
jgi:hypothetical protein